MRVHELAKELGIENKKSQDILDKNVEKPQSLTGNVADEIRNMEEEAQAKHEKKLSKKKTGADVIKTEAKAKIATKTADGKERPKKKSSIHSRI